VPFVVIVRGPLGVGKSTVSERLAREIGAEHISIDRILDEEGVWYDGRLSEFLRANEVAAVRARGPLGRGTSVVFDGNFYWETQIVDLLERFACPSRVFTLSAPLGLCIERDGRREPPHGADAAREVYRKSTAVEWGIEIDATPPVESVVRAIRERLP
jgi:predicted kinase